MIKPWRTDGTYCSKLYEEADMCLNAYAQGLVQALSSLAGDVATSGVAEPTLKWLPGMAFGPYHNTVSKFELMRYQDSRYQGRTRTEKHYTDALPGVLKILKNSNAWNLEVVRYLCGLFEEHPIDMYLMCDTPRATHGTRKPWMVHVRASMRGADSDLVPGLEKALLDNRVNAFYKAFDLCRPAQNLAESPVYVQRLFDCIRNRRTFRLNPIVHDYVFWPHTVPRSAIFTVELLCCCIMYRVNHGKDLELTTRVVHRAPGVARSTTAAPAPRTRKRRARDQGCKEGGRFGQTRRVPQEQEAISTPAAVSLNLSSYTCTPITGTTDAATFSLPSATDAPVKSFMHVPSTVAQTPVCVNYVFGTGGTSSASHLCHEQERFQEPCKHTTVSGACDTLPVQMDDTVVSPCGFSDVHVVAEDVTLEEKTHEGEAVSYFQIKGSGTRHAVHLTEDCLSLRGKQVERIESVEGRNICRRCTKSMTSVVDVTVSSDSECEVEQDSRAIPGSPTPVAQPSEHTWTFYQVKGSTEKHVVHLSSRCPALRNKQVEPVTSVEGRRTCTRCSGFAPLPVDSMPEDAEVFYDAAPSAVVHENDDQGSQSYNTDGEAFSDVQVPQGTQPREFYQVTGATLRHVVHESQSCLSLRGKNIEVVSNVDGRKRCARCST